MQKLGNVEMSLCLFLPDMILFEDYKAVSTHTMVIFFPMDCIIPLNDFKLQIQFQLHNQLLLKTLPWRNINNY